MKKIDFSSVKMFMDVAHTHPVVQDVRASFADIVYNLGSGIACHALALKIFNSKGEEEYSEDECNLIKAFAEKCTPSFIDAVNELIK